MILDKTGTLTQGTMALVRWSGDAKWRELAAAVEAGSSHPIAVALSDGGGGDPPCAVADVRQHPGRGVTAFCDDQHVLIASPAFAAEAVGTLALHWQNELRVAVDDGLTPVVMVVDDEVVAVAALGDPIRDDSPTALDKIRGLGWSIEVLSGDHPGTVGAVLRRVGLDPAVGRGGVGPEEKADVVERAARSGRTVMVGDGVNDAAALAAATVGIGVHGGAEAALAAADVYLGRPGLAPLHRLLVGSRRAFRVIRRNLLFSLLYNVVAVSLAMAGLMHPLLAAILMPLSSMTVVVSSYRSTIFERNPEP